MIEDTICYSGVGVTPMIEDTISYSGVGVTPITIVVTWVTLPARGIRPSSIYPFIQYGVGYHAAPPSHLSALTTRTGLND